MLSASRIVLHKNKAEAVKRFHPWIFSGAIKQADSALQDGDLVEVYGHDGEYLATGFYAPGSIAVKIFSFEKVEALDYLFIEKLKSAYSLRAQVGLATSETTNCYRLVNAEGDGFPGLIIDWYNGTAVIQAHAIGIYQQRELLVQALQAVYGSELKAVYDKSASVLFKKAKAAIQSDAKDSYLVGSRIDDPVLEYGHPFLVNWEEGQKTGFFVDQRENRHLLAKYAAGKKVLNTFCYSGGFSVYALKAGAAQVHSVDSSARAMEWTNQNVALNLALKQPQPGAHESFTGDVFDFLKSCDADYDVIVLDPPAFAKTLSARHQAVLAYKRLNKQAFAKVKSGGLVFTFSCSQVVGTDYFTGAVTAGAIESGRKIRILHHLSQPADHPISIYHPEGLYLKGLVLRVE